MEILGEFFGKSLPDGKDSQSSRKQISKNFNAYTSLCHHGLLRSDLKYDGDACCKFLRNPIYLSILKEYLDSLCFEVCLEILCHKSVPIEVLKSSVPGCCSEVIVSLMNDNWIIKKVYSDQSLREDPKLGEKRKSPLSEDPTLDNENRKDNYHVEMNVKLLDTIVLLRYAQNALSLKFNEEMSLVFKACYDSLLMKKDLNGRVSRLQIDQKLSKKISLRTENESSDGLTEYLRLISNPACPILRSSSDSFGSYGINWPQLSIFCRKSVLETFVGDVLGSSSLRIIRIIIDKEMVDEKMISKLALLNGKDVRENLFRLFRLGLINIQEVPRSSDRQVSKTFFLWRCHLREACNALNTMSLRIIMNLATFKHDFMIKHSRLVEKLERKDVNFDMSKVSVSEKKTWESYSKKLKFLTIKITKLEETRCVLSFST